MVISNGCVIGETVIRKSSNTCDDGRLRGFRTDLV